MNFFFGGNVGCGGVGTLAYKNKSVEVFSVLLLRRDSIEPNRRNRKTSKLFFYPFAALGPKVEVR